MNETEALTKYVIIKSITIYLEREIGNWYGGWASGVDPDLGRVIPSNFPPIPKKGLPKGEPLIVCKRPIVWSLATKAMSSFPSTENKIEPFGNEHSFQMHTTNIFSKYPFKVKYVLLVASAT